MYNIGISVDTKVKPIGLGPILLYQPPAIMVSLNARVHSIKK